MTTVFSSCGFLVGAVRLVGLLVVGKKVGKGFPPLVLMDCEKSNVNWDLELDISPKLGIAIVGIVPPALFATCVNKFHHFEVGRKWSEN